MPHISLRPHSPSGILQARPKVFVEGHEKTPGVGLFLDRGLIQFLTPEQALTLANQLADSYAQIKETPNA